MSELLYAIEAHGYQALSSQQVNVGVQIMGERP